MGGPDEPERGQAKTAGGPCGGNAPGCRDHAVDRRQFIKLAGAGAAAVATGDGLTAVAGPLDKNRTVDHFVPTDKKLDPEWVEMLFAKGQRTWYRGKDLETIGMPIGGICAGQVYLSGDGRLVYWGIFNQNLDTGGGQINYKVGRKPEEAVLSGGRFVERPSVDQGCAIQVNAGEKTVVRRLDAGDFPGVRFSGEYPIGYVEYADEGFPVAVKLEAFSPLIPLDTADSALPATVLNYTITNTTDAAVDVTLIGWLQNVACLHSGPRLVGRAVHYNRVEAGNGFTAVAGGVKAVDRGKGPGRPPMVFAPFEGGDYGPWKVEGKAFGRRPVRGASENQHGVSGFKGKGLVNTYVGGDRRQGRLISPKFTIERPWIGFLLGGGGHEGKTCINLVVDDKVVRTATGTNNDRLLPCNWDVKELLGREARIEIVDHESGDWGHVDVDQIEFRDLPMDEGADAVRLLSDYGTMAIAVLGDGDVIGVASLPHGDATEKPLDEVLRGAVGKTITLGPAERKTVTLVVSWCMPNMYRNDLLVGNYYAKRFRSATAVVAYIAANYGRLASQTRLWHDTYYDSTLPHWLLDRIGATVCNLASTTCQWWRNGRFWAWEGAGCCHGTCGHVWNYAHAVARLFPELERSARNRQDFAPGVGFVPETGEIRFRGEGWKDWAGDAQGGYILKAYREHLCSPSNDFLKRNWPNIRKALQFLIEQDGDADGLIEGRQHQTYDADYYGANTFVGSLYLGALRAAEEMAREVGDDRFADQCRAIFRRGSENSVRRLFNGEYYVQEVDLKRHRKWQYADGCLADQMFGQGWAHQVGLGYLYPRETVLKSLRSVWRHCWSPDVALQNAKHRPQRCFASSGEAGLFTCTWPNGQHLGPKSTRYRNEIWTGIEYQVAGHMAWEGMLTECLAICRAVHERYHPSKHNPFNEIECGDHYARAMASWGVLVGLSGFTHHGPAGRIGFAPRFSPEDFRGPFTAAEGWGTISQRCDGSTQTDVIAVKWGRLRVKTLSFALLSGSRLQSITVTVAGKPVKFTQTVKDRSVEIELARPETVETGEQVEVTMIAKDARAGP